MWNIKAQYLKNEGFSLIEIIMVLGLSSLVLLTVISILSFSSNISTKVENEDEVMLYGRYVIDYIKDEIRGADLIISSRKFSNLDNMYPTNIGFVVMEDRGENFTSDRYNFFTYYLRGDNLIRLAYNKHNKVYPEPSKLSGFNVLCEGVLSIDGTNLDYDNKLLKIKLSLGNNKKEIHCFKTTIFLTTNFDY